MSEPESTSPRIAASRFSWADPRMIPPRKHVYGKHYTRGFISESVAAGGVGKSALAIVESLAITSFRALLRVMPAERTNVWYWNGEDPLDELQRRFAAAMLRYEIEPREIEGRLFIDSGRNMPIAIVEQTRIGPKINAEAVDAIVATISANEIGVMIVDPLVASHRVVENNNSEMELVARAWAEIADRAGAAIELVHHSRKTGGAVVEVEDGRGGNAIPFKARSVRTLNPMTSREAAACGLSPEESRFRIAAGGKRNLGPRSTSDEWYAIENVELPNGDHVGVVRACERPRPLASVTVGELAKAQAAVAAGGPWRENAQSTAWVGIPIAQTLGISLEAPEGKPRVLALIKGWTRAGHFVVVDGFDERRKPKKFVRVGRSFEPVGEPASSDELAEVSQTANEACSTSVH